MHNEDGNDFPFVFGSQVSVADREHRGAGEIQGVDVSVEPGLVEVVDVLGPVEVGVAVGSQHQDNALNKDECTNRCTKERHPPTSCTI